MKSERKTRRFANKSRNPKRRSIRFTSHELVFQPWFLPRQSRLAIDALIPPGYRNKMRAYFDDYGCMICGRSNVAYDANGLCIPCHKTIRRRLKRSVRRRMTGNRMIELTSLCCGGQNWPRNYLGGFRPIGERDR